MARTAPRGLSPAALSRVAPTGTAAYCAGAQRGRGGVPIGKARLLRKIALGACLAASIGLGGCAAPPPLDPPSGGGKVFAAGLDDITGLYLDPVTDRNLALAGLARLTRLDGSLAIGGAADAVALDYGGYHVARYAMPAGRDAAGWGALIAQAVAAARRVSPTLAGMPEERIETAVFFGMTDTLDRFSRYAPPGKARALSAAWGGLAGTVRMTLAGDVAVFRIADFNRHTAAHVAEGIAEARRRTGGRLAGVVLDLRGNPGGLLAAAAKLADLFIAKGPIVATWGRNPASRQAFTAAGDSIAPQVPVAVLIDGGSASASEIVAAALQDRGRAVVIGTASFGKGTVQTVQRLPNNGDLIITWARLVAPSGYLLQHHGVVPTVCTAGLADDPQAVAAAVQRAAAMTVGAAGPRARAALDESAWAALRQSCPPRRQRGGIDLAVAERLLADASLYRAALDAVPQPTRLAAGTAAP